MNEGDARKKKKKKKKKKKEKKEPAGEIFACCFCVGPSSAHERHY
jgi:hypothetical protein